MTTDIKSFIKEAREHYPSNSIVTLICDELDKQLDINEQNLSIKQNLADENQRLRAENEELHRQSSLRQRTIEQMRAAEPVGPNQQMLEQMIEDLRGLANPQNPTVPPLSSACLRQHASMSALNGLLAAGALTTPREMAKQVVIYADALVQELAK